MSDRGAGDRKRHREKVRNAIKENLGNIISEEAIIGQSGDKKVKVPIKGVKEYRFIFGSNNAGVAQGTGQEQPGDIVQSGADKAPGAGPAGSEPGDDIYETEVTLDELIELLFEDLELPDLEKKKLHYIQSERLLKRKGYRTQGIRVRLSRKKTVTQRIKRKQASKRALLQHSATDGKALMTGNGGSQGGAPPASEEWVGNVPLPVDLPESADPEGTVNGGQNGGGMKAPQTAALPQAGSLTEEPKRRFPFHNDDLRYNRVVPDVKRHSNAVIFCIMDTSGSMDMTKKYLARSFYFLLYRFLLTRYQNTEVVFIAHHTEAQEVTEDEFFHKGESGGTKISSGYKRALEIIESRYHPSLWNIYAFHCSDGDNFDEDNEEAIRSAEALARVANLFGYGEIKPQGSYSWSSMLERYQQIKADNFVTVKIHEKEDLWPAFRYFLGKDRTEK
ncbi:MAG: DUF444 family protein [Candidatus Tectomicrobia bacterium]|uniref:DUF444 family protein n=1 Tax=Tectimicrobiota bacterium TaxID=2528274 RepID=A0A932FUH0_UNCTE|nr:DUF444 family protein [Candidatus Tectomicrobia bacterium]